MYACRNALKSLPFRIDFISLYVIPVSVSHRFAFSSHLPLVASKIIFFDFRTDFLERIYNPNPRQAQVHISVVLQNLDLVLAKLAKLGKCPISCVSEALFL